MSVSVPDQTVRRKRFDIKRAMSICGRLSIGSMVGCGSVTPATVDHMLENCLVTPMRDPKDNLGQGKYHGDALARRPLVIKMTVPY